ncbi:MAG: glycyl-radical enzyme activating protein, partial [Treponema sp.]|nr:glycyl-radical enzyme activating protein [Treponema sp.]
GLIFNIQRFSIHDGPGIRTTVFMKGCNLRCYWCHNPESLKAAPEIQFVRNRCIGCGACADACPAAAEGRSARFTPGCTGCGACAGACYPGALTLAGKRYTAQELAGLLLKDRELMAGSGGGVTFSGGEPLLQADFAAAALSALKHEGVHTAIETASNLEWEAFEKVLPFTDLFICDIKASSAELHRLGTGVSNGLILENLRRLSGTGAEILLRIPVIPGFNDSEETILETGGFVRSLGRKAPVELLAFHNICAGKYDALGRDFAARGKEPPQNQLMEQLAQALRSLGLEVIWKQ